MSFSEERFDNEGGAMYPVSPFADEKPSMVLAYALVALSGALVGLIAGYFLFSILITEGYLPGWVALVANQLVSWKQAWGSRPPALLHMQV